jgi:hypothetical protein
MREQKNQFQLVAGPRSSSAHNAPSSREDCAPVFYYSIADALVMGQRASSEIRYGFHLILRELLKFMKMFG